MLARSLRPSPRLRKVFEPRHRSRMQHLLKQSVSDPTCAVMLTRPIALAKMSRSDDPCVSSLFARLRDGDSSVKDELVPRLYATIRELAHAHMRRQRNHTLQTSDLVNEAYVKVFDRSVVHIRDRVHFMKLTSRVMRNILVDHARRKSARKRTPPGDEVALDQIVVEYNSRAAGLVPLDEALERLHAKDPEVAELIELRFFGGRTVDECAKILEISERQAYRWWQTARAWLRQELEDEST